VPSGEGRSIHAEWFLRPLRLIEMEKGEILWQGVLQMPWLFIYPFYPRCYYVVVGAVRVVEDVSFCGLLSTVNN
jgi:hypothetical protein